MDSNIYINANDFIESLHAKGLIIVSAREYEVTKDIDRRRVMKKKAISIKEIVDFKLLPVRSKKGVENWIKLGKIKPDETYKETTGKKKIMILTSAIRRLGYED